MLVTTILDARMHPLSRASPLQAYSLYPSLGLLGRVVSKKGGENGEFVDDMCSVVGTGVVRALVLANDT